MYLKALEIQGFKSFPEKTVLQFGQDVTAIVGPNGSGKSNISDAICWVMGEQSAKSLRGAKMEDVIFGGTEKRKAVGFAQVTLVLDNSGHIFPTVEASEVMVTRRYYRSGESEYYINKQAVRLKDVNELFMDTGLGREGYSIIGQGRIDEILSVRSTDRREIFEEAAGISKYRHRKEETERKIERTEENLVRIGDKISELELQVEPLREQAEKAKRFLILRDELRLLEISVWLEKLQELRAAQVRLQAELGEARERQAAAQAELDGLYEENERFSERVRDNDTRQESLRAEAEGLESQAAGEESAMAVLRTEIQHKRDSMAEIRQEMSRQEDRGRDARREMERQEKRIAGIAGRIAGLERALEELRRQAAEAAKSAGAVGEEIHAIQAQEAQAAGAVGKAREEISALQAALQQMEERQGAVGQDLAAAQAQLEKAEKESKAARRALEDAQDEVASIANVIAGHTLRMEGREKREKNASEVHMRLTMELNNMDSRIRLLEEMEKEYEGFSKAVRTVMQAAEKNVLRGVRGPVASLMKVDRQYAVALEIALGAGLQNIVVDREEVAKSAIALLKQRDAGRATFLPLTAIRGDELKEKGVEDAPGFVGIASRLVRYDFSYDNIFKNLLGRTVVVEDLDCGIAMARKYQNRFRIVTLDGQVINRGGSMTGGSTSKNAGVLSRANELETLRGRRASLAERLSEAQREKEAAARDLNAARYELEVASDERRTAEDAVLKLQGQVEQYRVLVEGVRTNIANLEGEQSDLADRVADSQKRQAAAQKTLEDREAEAAGLRSQWEEKLAGQSDLQEANRRIGEEMTERSAELAGLRSEKAGAEENLERMRRTEADLAGDREQRQARLKDYDAQVAQAEAEIGRRTGAAASWRLKSKGLREELRQLQEAKLALEADRGAMSRRLQACNNELLEAGQRVSALEQRIAGSGNEEKNILDRLWETYELSHSEAMKQRIELESVPKANRRIGELKREIGSLGNVNVGAIEEFDRVNERYTYLSGQRDDVQQSKDALSVIVDQLTKEMTGIFAEQFKLIKEAFQETFQDLFGGGRATLELEDPEHILDCGIEIKVQPPGKTLKTLSLLSGGEKAFVAIALYFAILKVHPTPFCVMDEIEAALDEANVVRVAKYMRGISDKTQFIVITHRRGTMEAADILYGVTMQEKGVSKLLAIDLNDVAKELKIP